MSPIAQRYLQAARAALREGEDDIVQYGQEPPATALLSPIVAEREKSELSEKRIGDSSGNAPKPRQASSRRCTVCGATEFWSRSAEVGGGAVRARCHPNPQALLAEWARRSNPAPKVPFSEKRGRLFSWALEHGCPQLQFRRGASVVGTPSGWLTFLKAASEDDLGAALQAAEREVDGGE